MNKFIDKALAVFNSRFGAILMTIVTVFLLFTVYKRSENANIIYLFFIIVILISIVFMITFLNYMVSGKKEYSPLFNRAFLTLMSSIITLLIVKTMLTFNFFPILAITISVFLFYYTLHELFKSFK
jgi:hypothetical protein